MSRLRVQKDRLHVQAGYFVSERDITRWVASSRKPCQLSTGLHVVLVPDWNDLDIKFGQKHMLGLKNEKWRLSRAYGCLRFSVVDLSTCDAVPILNVEYEDKRNIEQRIPK